jgi:hypothetical protein
MPDSKKQEKEEVQQFYMQTIQVNGAAPIDEKGQAVGGNIEQDIQRNLPNSVSMVFQQYGVKDQWQQNFTQYKDIFRYQIQDEAMRALQKKLLAYCMGFFVPITIIDSYSNPIQLIKNQLQKNKIVADISKEEKSFQIEFSKPQELQHFDFKLNNSVTIFYEEKEGTGTGQVQYESAKIDVHYLFFMVLMSTSSSSESQLGLQTQFNSEQWHAVAQALAPLMHTVEMDVFDVQMAFEKANLLRPALEKSTVFFGLKPGQQTRLLGILLSDAFSSLEKDQQTRLLGILLSDAFSSLEKEQQTRLLSAALSSQKIMGMSTGERLQWIKENPNGPHPHRHKVPIILALVLSTLTVTGITLIAVWPTIDSLLNISDSVVKALSLQDCAHITIGQCTLFPAYIVLAAGLLYGIQTLCHDSKTEQIAKAMKDVQVAPSAN